MFMLNSNDGAALARRTQTLATTACLPQGGGTKRPASCARRAAAAGLLNCRQGSLKPNIKLAAHKGEPSRASPRHSSPRTSARDRPCTRVHRRRDGGKGGSGGDGPSGSSALKPGCASLYFAKALVNARAPAQSLTQ